MTLILVVFAFLLASLSPTFSFHSYSSSTVELVLALRLSDFLVTVLELLKSLVFQPSFWLRPSELPESCSGADGVSTFLEIEGKSGHDVAGFEVEGERGARLHKESEGLAGVIGVVRVSSEYGRGVQAYGTGVVKG